MVRNLLSNKGKENTDMKKKQYIRPVVELIHHDYLCAPGIEATVSAAEYWDARETEQFMEEDSNGKGFGYRRYNLWED